MAKVKAEDKKSFIMYVDYQCDFEMLTGDECKALMLAIFNYERNNEEPVFEERFMKMTWQRIQRDLDRNDSAWLETKQALSEAGKKGAEKRWHNQDSHPIASDSHPIPPNSQATTPLGSIAVNANVNANANVNDNVNEFIETSTTKLSNSLSELRSENSEEEDNNKGDEGMNYEEDNPFPEYVEKVDIYSEEYMNQIPF